MFSYLSKALFSGFLQFKGNFVDGRNNSKYRDVAPLTKYSLVACLKFKARLKILKSQARAVGIVQCNKKRIKNDEFLFFSS